jgi:hypothetical protein
VAAVVFTPFLCLGQAYKTNTLAARGRPTPAPGARRALSLFGPGVLALDASGNVYAARRDGVFKIDGSPASPRKIPARVAGTEGEWRYSGDGDSALTARMNPRGIAVDSAGHLYLADSANHRIRKVDASTGVITTVAGTGVRGYSGDGGPAVDAQLDEPSGIVVDAAGNLYIADGTTFSRNRIRRVDAATGVITTVAGNGSHGYSGDGGPATSAQFHSLGGMALDRAGNLYIADNYNNRIRMVSAKTGMITTVAGTGTVGHSGDGDLATRAQLNNPLAVAVNAQGDLFIADSYNYRIRKVTRATGIIATLQEDSTAVYGDGRHGFPGDLALDAAGNLYILDSGISRIRKAPVETAVWSKKTEGFAGPHGFASATSSGLTINVTYCSSSETSNSLFDDCKSSSNYVPSSAETAFNSIVSTYEALFSNDITVNICVQFGSTSLGESDTFLAQPTYSSWRSALKSNASSNPGNIFVVAAAASLPSSDPIGGGTVDGQTANLRAIGFSVSTSVDSNLTFSNSTSFEYTGVANINDYDFMDVATHELDEALAISSALTGLANNATLPTNDYYVEDYFRYSSSGSRSISTSPSAAVYFSYNGGSTTVAQFNQDDKAGDSSGADRNDWIYGADVYNSSLGYSPGTCPAVSPGPYIQDAVGCPDEAVAVGQLGSPEWIVLGSLGYTVTLTSQTITFNSLSGKTYGASAFSVSATASSGLSVSFTSTTTTVCTVSSSTITIVAAGTCSITASQAGSTIYAAATSVSQSFTVSKASLTVTANNLSITYGTTVSPTVTFSGFQNSDTSSVVSGSATFSINATLTNGQPNVGSWTLTPAVGTLAASNYTFGTFKTGTLTVSKASLTVTANNQTIAYGTATPTFTDTVTGFVNSDSSSVVSGAATFSNNATFTNSKPNAGSWTITPAVGTLSATNYTFGTFTAGTLTVSKVALTVTASNQSITYGTATPTFTDTVTGFVNSDSSSVVSGAASFTNNATFTNSKPNAGSWTITPAAGTLAASNYSFGTFTTGTLTVSKAALTVTANNISITYGATLSPTVTVTGFVNSDSSSVVSGSASFSNNATLTNSQPNAGSWTITPAVGTLSASNYSFGTFTAGTLTVSKVTLTVTANAVSITYGGTLSSTATITGFVNSDTSAVVSGAASLSNNATLTNGQPNAGTWTITPAIGTLSASNYTFGTFTTGTLTVSKAALTVTATSQTITYGTATPTFTDTITGLVNSDSSSVVSGAATFANNATFTNSKPNAGSWTITPAIGTLSASNYTFGTFTAGTLTVSKATLTVTANNLSVTYAATISPTVTITGFVNSDTSSVVSGTANYLFSAPLTNGKPDAGSYTFTPTAGSLSASNYTFGTGTTYVNGTLTVNKATLTVTANAISITYGATLSPTATITGFVNSDNSSVVGGTASFTNNATLTNSQPNAGSWTITPAIGTLSATNYTFGTGTTYATGTLTVSKATLTVTANNISITYGGTLSPTATVTGFVNSDTSTVVSGTASFSNNATLTNGQPNAGSWTITPAIGTLSATNYTFGTGTTYATGTLTVSKATLTVTANNISITYGGTLSPTTTITGFVNSDTSTVVSGTASFSNNATLTNGQPNAGSWTITPAIGTLSTTNYTFGTGTTYATGTLTVNKATLAVTANGQTITYGTAMPTFTATITGFVNSDTSAVVSGTASFLTNATLTNGVPNAGSWTITPSVGTLSAANYTFGSGTVYAAGTLTVNQATLTVTANNLSTAGSTKLPVLTATITGFVNSDTFSGSTNTFPTVNNGDTLSGAVIGTISLATTATSSSASGNYPINAGSGGLGLSAANYAISFVAGSLTVTATTAVTEAAFSGIALNFGTQTVGVASATQTVTITNIGSASLTVTTVSASGDFSQTNNCGTVAVADACAVTVGFTPTATGTRSGSLIVTDNGSNSPQVIPLSGFGAGSMALLSLSNVGLNFGSQATNTTSAAQTVTLTNNGGTTLTVSSVTASGSFAQSNNCGSVAASGTCTISVTFTPIATGSSVGFVAIVDSATGSPHLIRLSGSGTNAAGPAIGLSNVSLNFGSQTTGTTSSAQTITVTNTGTATLTITGVAATGDFAASGCVTSLAAGASCTLSVTFTPSAAGSRRGTVAFAANVTGSAPVIWLFGSGT